MTMALKSVPSLIGFAFLFVTSCAFAGADAASAWNLEPQSLLEVQAPADVSELLQTLESTRQTAHAMEQKLRANDVNQMAMIRFKYGADQIWLLYRLKEKVFVVDLSLRQGRVIFRTMGEAIPSEWNALFNTLLVHQQKQPTPPLAAGRSMRVGEFWPRGYTGLVNIDNEGASRTYLLATEDISILDAQSAVDALLCSTIFSGMHCHNGDRVLDGWVQQQLNLLMKHSQPIRQSLID